MRMAYGRADHGLLSVNNTYQLKEIHTAHICLMGNIYISACTRSICSLCQNIVIYNNTDGDSSLQMIYQNLFVAAVSRGKSGDFGTVNREHTVINSCPVSGNHGDNQLVGILGIDLVSHIAGCICNASACDPDIQLICKLLCVHLNRLAEIDRSDDCLIQLAICIIMLCVGDIKICHCDGFIFRDPAGIKCSIFLYSAVVAVEIKPVGALRIGIPAAEYITVSGRNFGNGNGICCCGRLCLMLIALSAVNYKRICPVAGFNCCVLCRCHQMRQYCL